MTVHGSGCDVREPDRVRTDLQAALGHDSMHPIVIHNSILLCLSRCVAAVYETLEGR